MTPNDLSLAPTARGWRVTNSDNGELLGWVRATGRTWAAFDQDDQQVGGGFVNRMTAALHLTGVHAYRFTARFLDTAR